VTSGIANTSSRNADRFMGVTFGAGIAPVDQRRYLTA
jgi:hypothetical protein